MEESSRVKAMVMPSILPLRNISYDLKWTNMFLHRTHLCPTKVCSNIFKLYALIYVASPAWNAVRHRPPSTLCQSTRMLLTLKANLRVMLSEGSTPPIRKLSSGKLPNTVSSFSSVKRKIESVKTSQEKSERQNNNNNYGLSQFIPPAG